MSAVPAGGTVGERYLAADEIASRVRELGVEISADYAELEPILVAPLKSSVVFLADLSRALAFAHEIDFLELAAYGSGTETRTRLLKDLDRPINGRHLLLVEDVVDTGLTLNFLLRTLQPRNPASVAVVTLLDRPYRRLVDDLPVRYVGFTVPDEVFVGYGFDLDQRYRNLRDIFLAEPASRVTF